jgi:hypothetical protein
MKKKFLFIPLCFLILTSVFSQIPVNTCIPRTIAPTINVWDWRQTLWEWYFPNQATGQTVSTMLENPYWATPNMINANIIDLANTLNKNYDPVDGWELLQRQMGSPGVYSNGKLNPFVLLYNKYTGTIRVFINITNSSRAKTALVKLRFQNGSPQTALLSSNTAVAESIRDYGLNKELMMPNDYSNAGNNNGTYWVFADFQVAYDPCTCSVPATIFIAAYLTDKMDIIASIKNTTISENIVSDGSTNNNLNFKSAISLVAGAGESAKSYYESADKFVDEVAKFNQSGVYKTITNKGVIDKVKLDNTLARITPALSAVPYVGAFVGAASFIYSFFKGNSNESTVAAFPNLDLTLSGTISSTNKYGDIFLNVPGGDHAGQSSNFNPNYDNILGVISLVKNPSVEYKDYLPSPASLPISLNIIGDAPGRKYTIYFPNVREYKVKTVPYSINPAAGLKVHEMQARLLVTISDIPKQATSSYRGSNSNLSDTILKRLIGPFETEPYPSTSYESRMNNWGNNIENWPDINRINNITYSTGYKPMSCFYESRFKMFFPTGTKNPDIKCQLLVTLIPINNDTTRKVFIKLTYNVDIEQSTLSGTKNYFINQKISTCSARGCIPDYDYNIVRIDEYWPNAYPSTTCSGERLVTQADINSFCGSSLYKRNTAYYSTQRIGLAMDDGFVVEEETLDNLKVYPNPYFSGGAFIEISQATEGQSKVKLIDMEGNIVLHIQDEFSKQGVKTIPLDAKGLSSGMYICIFESPDGVLTEKFIVIK